MKTSLLIKHLFGTLLFFAIIFLSAGRIDYWQGQVYVTIGLLMFILNYTAFRIDSELVNERNKKSDDVKSWDKLILGLSFSVTIIMYIIAGLDTGRFHWSPEFHWSITSVGIILTITGQLFFLIAQKQNNFFSSTVRVQKEREHVVCETGLYKFVRHPAYLGSIIQLIGFPLLFGSFWSIIPIIILVFLQIARTYLEDNLLKKELNGYDEYSRKTRFKIFPYVW